MRAICGLILLLFCWRINPGKSQCSEEDWSTFGTQGAKTICSDDSYVSGLRTKSDSSWYEFDDMDIIAKAKCCKAVSAESDCLDQELEW